MGVCLFCSCVVCFCCISFSFFSNTPRDWPIFCRVWCKTLTQSISQSILHWWFCNRNQHYYCYYCDGFFIPGSACAPQVDLWVGCLSRLKSIWASQVESSKFCWRRDTTVRMSWRSQFCYKLTWRISAAITIRKIQLNCSNAAKYGSLQSTSYSTFL